MNTIPLVDVSDLVTGKDITAIAQDIRAACTTHGFFYISGHGISRKLQEDLLEQSRLFFDQPVSEKMEIEMLKGGRAWRGYFPVGQELTSGKPDEKEGIYFGEELPASHPAVRAGLALHGRNLFPEQMPLFQKVVLDYMNSMKQLGHQLMRGISASLGLPPDYFYDHYTRDPLTLFRIFLYPDTARDDTRWGVGEHTDYGVLTILLQDSNPGLEVRTPQGWIPANPIENTFVCNIGDMLDRMTGGLYRSTPHRVRNVTGRARLSFPFFFDPNFQSVVDRLPLTHNTIDDQENRWDRASVHHFSGTYGEYLLSKVSKVFPYLYQANREER